MPELPDRFGDRFEVERLLGKGGWGTVYAVHDVQEDVHVALKHLRQMEPESLIRFKREFRAVAELDDPNLVRLYELFGDAEGRWFYTMERVDGDHLTTALGVRHVPHTTFDLADSAEAPPPDAPVAVDIERVRTLFGQLAHALQAVHAAGLLHRDLKPSNVMVAGDRVVLLDFGIVGDATSAESGSIGTPAYMAPEQGTPDEPATPASDWYALGVMLFEVLTGRLPFLGTAATMTATKLATDGPDPREIAPAAPPDLAELCVALLRRDPTARPSGAAVVRRLGAAPATASPPSRFVGRRTELARLRSLMVAGVPAVALLAGPSGQGKTALAAAFLREVRAEHPDALILSSRSRPQESVPFKALDGVLDGLVGALGAVDPTRVRELVPPGARALGELFPVLMQLPAFAAGAADESDDIEPRARRRLAGAALKLLFARLSAERPVIWLLDDLHWGDADSAVLLDAVWAPPDAPPILVIGTARPDPSPCISQVEASALERDVRFERIDLGPLGPAESLELLGSTGGRADLDRLARQAGGNPWLLDTLVRFAATGGAAADLDGVFDQRIAALSEAARDVLTLLAVAGHPLDRRLARTASGLGNRFDEAVHALEVARLVRFRRDGAEGGFECYHDRIRESVLATVPESRQRALHAELARTLANDPEDLLIHLVEAGLLAEATDCAERLGEQALAALAFVLAAEHFATAAACCTDDPARALALRRRRAEALAESGRLVEAAHAYLDAAEGAPDGVELRRRAALHLLNAGRLDEGLAVARGVCSAVGIAPPASPRYSLAQVLGGRIWLKWRGLGFEERPESACDPAALLRHDTLEMLADGLGVVDTARAAALRQRALHAALDLGEPRRVATALFGLAQAVSLPGPSAAPTVAPILSLAESLLARLDDPGVHATAEVTRGAIAYLSGRPVQCGAHMQNALDLIETHRVRLLYEYNQARVFRVYGAYYAGDLRTATALVRRYRDVARDAGNLYLKTFMATAEASILLPARDDPDRGYAEMDAVMRDWSQLGYHIQHWWALKARCDLDLYCGLPRRCLDRLAADWPLLDRSLLHRVQAALLTNLFLRARANAALALEGDRAALAAATLDLAGIRKQDSALAPAYAAHVEAALHHVHGRVDACDAALARAIAAYDQCGLGLFSRAGRCIQEHRAREPIRYSALEVQGVRAPARMIRMMYPALGAGLTR